jgi:hypothetical protein
VFENGAMSKSPPRNNKENVMLRKFAATLVATALIAGPAFAQSNGNSGATPTTPAAQATQAASSTAAAKPSVKPTAKTAKTVKHTAKHVRKHVARSPKKGAAMHQARHAKPATAHQAGIANTAKRS